MELDNFLTSPRWEILQLISKKPSSPVEISEQLKTTVSYISQQLKLLEIAGIVKKQRTGAVEKGKPRTIFSILKEFAYIVALTEDFSEKKLLSLNENQKVVIRIWLLEDKNLHTPLEKFFWGIEHLLKDIEAIFIDSRVVPPKIILVSEKSIKLSVDSVLKKLREHFDLEVIPLQANSNFDSFHRLYSKARFNQKQLKGGNE
jgi:DNA-binding transcriptional ArsR family regulator